MLQLSFNSSDLRVAAYVRSKFPTIMAYMARQMDKLDTMLQSHIVNDKLSGQVLHHRTGKLAASVRVIRAVISGSSISGGVQAAGGAAWYGVVQEKGGTREYDIFPVNKKALAFFPQGSAGAGLTSANPAYSSIYSGRRGINRKLRESGLGLASEMGLAVVRHVHHLPLPARPFMSTAAQEFKSQYREGMKAAVDQALKQKGVA